MGANGDGPQQVHTDSEADRQRQPEQPAAGEVQVILLQLPEVFGERKHRFIGVVGRGLEAHGRHFSAADLLRSGIPPFHADGWQRVSAGAVDAIAGAVDTLAAEDIAATVIQRSDLWRLRVATRRRHH